MTVKKKRGNHWEASRRSLASWMIQHHRSLVVATLLVAMMTTLSFHQLSLRFNTATPVPKGVKDKAPVSTTSDPSAMSSNLRSSSSLDPSKQNDRENTSSDSVTSSHSLSTANKTSTTNQGIIIVNMLGLLANNLFQVAMANRLSRQLQWPVIYRIKWEGVVHPQATRIRHCFPNLLLTPNIPNGSNIDDNDELLHLPPQIRYGDLPASLRDDPVFRNATTRDFWNTIISPGMDSSNPYYDDWFQQINPFSQGHYYEGRESGIASIDTSQLVVPIYHRSLQMKGFEGTSDQWTNSLVKRLQDPTSRTKILHLEAFFIHYDWMFPWMSRIRQWAKIADIESTPRSDQLEEENVSTCCSSPRPSPDTIVVHWRDFAADESAKDLAPPATADLVSVFVQILKHYELPSDDAKGEGTTTERPVWIVCQPSSIETEAVQRLVALLKPLAQEVRIVPGRDNIDAMCILQRARTLLLTTSSTFSQFPAIIGHADSDSRQVVHYPIYTTFRPIVTLKVPHWHYHLYYPENSTVAAYDIPHDWITPRYD